MSSVENQLNEEATSELIVGSANSGNVDYDEDEDIKEEEENTNNDNCKDPEMANVAVACLRLLGIVVRSVEVVSSLLVVDVETVGLLDLFMFQSLQL